MPIQVTYPGVYIAEVPAGSSAIVAVSTSITAFLGRSPMGQVDQPVTIFSFEDYQDAFGRLAPNYPMSYAVRDFFLNGGGQAVIVRLIDDQAAAATVDTEFGWTLTAASPGTWANAVADPSASCGPVPRSSLISGLGVTIQALDPNDPATKLLGLVPVPLFTVTVTYRPADGAVETEVFRKVTLFGSDPNRIDHVLGSQSKFVRARPVPPANGGSMITLPEYTPVPDTLLFGQAPHIAGQDSGPIRSILAGDPTARTGLYMLEHTDLFNILCVPPDDITQADGGIPQDFWPTAAQYCTTRRAMLIVEPLAKWSELARSGQVAKIDPTELGITGYEGRNACVYFPRVMEADPLNQNTVRVFSACGILAGIWAATDTGRGVWKAPAGLDAGINGIENLELSLTDEQEAPLIALGINCLRSFPTIGPVVWGSRTLRGADLLEDDYKYITVRRLTLFLEESLCRGTKWAAFEPNDETLWSSLRLSVDSFLAGLARQGAFYNYNVKCDSATTTTDDIQRGVVNIVVEFAPVTPAEFLVLQIQQMIGTVAA